MCSNFQPATIKQIEKILNNQLELDFDDYKSRVYPKDYCPIIIATDDGIGAVNGQFGLSPNWASDPVNYATYNARIETIENKKTFEPAYKNSQFCLVPMQAFFEPYYISGKNRWQRIYHIDNDVFMIAGMFEYNTHFIEPVHTFTLLTHNADDEKFMSRFHRPDKEKRSIYLVEPDATDEYLKADYEDIDRYMSPINAQQFKHADAE